MSANIMIFRNFNYLLMEISQQATWHYVIIEQTFCQV